MPAKSRRGKRPRGKREAGSAQRLLDEVRDGVLWLTLNRPDKRNALDVGLTAALAEQLERAELDAAVRLIAVRGAGKDFCAGADLRELLDSADRPVSENEQAAMALGEVFLRMRRLPKPVVAVVHGKALAGGCGLATACDLIVAHAAAQFGYPEIGRGFVPAMVTTMLRRAVTEKVAFDLVTTGRVLDAEEARDVGLVARVYPAKTFQRDARTFVGELAQASVSALALIKRQLYELDTLDFADGIRLGAHVNALARGTPDFKRAVQEFLRK
jgi:methylglutaconyl-CoA hydratase